MSTAQYVVGFMFNVQRTHVALILKEKPAWQRGKFNGVGGKIELGESALEAMVREFREETGHETNPETWLHYCNMSGGSNDGAGGGFEIGFFCCYGDIDALRSTESEKLSLIPIDYITPLWPRAIENVPWLIGLALDHLQDGRPKFTVSVYP
jgi:8-oxo-dGTP diphosphatase